MRGTAVDFIKQNIILTCALLVALLVYLPLLWYGPISWDDPEMVFMNQHVKSFSVTELFSGFFVGNYIPVTMLLHALTYKIFGNIYGGHHAVGILLHLLNGILVYMLSKRLFKSKIVANITTMAFLLHPVQVESVAWIGELKTVLSAMFFLCALIVYCRFLDTNNIKYFVITLILFILACLSKPSAIIFPLCLLCIQLIMQRKITWKSVSPLVPFFILSLIFGIINLKAQSEDQFINYAHQYPMHQKVAMAGIALVKYLQLFILPVKLSALYPYPALSVVNLISGFFVILALAGVIYYLFKTKNFKVTSIVLFILSNLVLVLQIVPFGEVLYADRYAYFPVIGFSWLLAVTIEHLKINVKVSLAIIIVLLAAVSISRIPVWKSGITLYEDIIRKYPAQFVALNSAGVESMRLNNDQQALDYFDRAIKVAPRNYKGFYNAGLLFLKMKKPEQAIQRFNGSLELYDYSKAYSARASAYLMLGDTDKALKDAQKAISLDNTNPNAFFVLGNSLSEKQELTEALEAYNLAVRFNGDQPDFYFRRAIVHGKLNNFPSSLADLERCTQLNPYYIEAYYWKGVAKVNLSQSPCKDFKIAARNNYEPAINAFKKYCQ